MSFDPYKALYIHIPFCVQKCNYCDFCSRVRDPEGPEVKEYTEYIVKEIRKASKEEKLGSIETIYIGGGTPSYIGSKNLSSILYAISMSINLENVKEFTIEANPESLREALVKDAWAMGVNRLSLGVQSFDDDLLKMLGRAHSAEGALEAIETARKRFENISIDLMCGIPGQSESTFEESLRKAIELNVPHISVYPLQIEPNTVFYKWKAQGKIDDVVEDDQADHMLLAAEVLEAAGYSHYEVSSYAKQGYESRHNLSYWKSKPYLGIGESATTMTQSADRRARVTDGQVDDELSENQMLAEDCVLALRTKSGISCSLADKARSTFKDFDKAVEESISLGLLKQSDGAFVPTEQGWLLGNELYLKFLSLE